MPLVENNASILFPPPIMKRARLLLSAFYFSTGGVVCGVYSAFLSAGDDDYLSLPELLPLLSF